MNKLQALLESARDDLLKLREFDRKIDLKSDRQLLRDCLWHCTPNALSNWRKRKVSFANLVKLSTIYGYDIRLTFVKK